MRAWVLGSFKSGGPGIEMEARVRKKDRRASRGRSNPYAAIWKNMTYVTFTVNCFLLQDDANAKQTH